MRTTAHRIADFIYEKLTGEKGVFSTRIAYVVKRGNRFELQIADADGAGEETALASLEPIISPAWSPDGAAPRLRFLREQEAGGVRALAGGRQAPGGGEFQGLELARRPGPPDGTQLAVSLSRDGGSQIYLVNADGSGVRRLTQSGGIDTEPVFSPGRPDRSTSPPTAAAARRSTACRRAAARRSA